MSKERQSLTRLIVTLGLAMILLLLLFGPAVYAQGIPKSFFDWAIAKKLTVTTGGADFQSDVTMDGVTLDMGGGVITDVATMHVTTLITEVTNLDVAEAITSSTAAITTANVSTLTATTASVTTGTVTSLTVTDLTMAGGTITPTHIAGRAAMLRIQDAAVADAYTNIMAETGVESATTSITSSSLTQPDYPRNVVISYTTETTATTGTLAVAGIDARGASTSEDLTVLEISGTQTITGSVPWADITSFTLPSKTEAVTFSVGTGNALGLPIIPAASSDVFMVTVNNVFTTAYTVDTTYGTVAPTVAVAANDDFSIWFKQ
jgi:hypothetical protein